MASTEGREASPEQAYLWSKYKELRNHISNKTSQEEVNYKINQVKSSKDSPDKVWVLAKQFMDWSSPGPPSQLEVEENKKITLFSKDCDISRLMNEFFISKVQNIVK